MNHPTTDVDTDSDSDSTDSSPSVKLKPNLNHVGRTSVATKKIDGDYYYSYTLDTGARELQVYIDKDGVDAAAEPSGGGGNG